MATRRKKKRTARKSCAGLNARTGRLKKGWKWKKGGKCPVRAKGK